MKFSKVLNLLLIAVLTASTLACKKDEATTTTETKHYYDPQIPWGNIDLNTITVANVKNLAANISILDKIKLTWTVPPLYTTLNYEIVIFKRKAIALDWVLPNPADEATPADFYKAAQFSKVDSKWTIWREGSAVREFSSTNGSMFLDENEIDENGTEITNVFSDTNYSYWVFVKLNDNDWSTGVRLNTKSKKDTSNFQLPTALNFWDKKKWSLGGPGTSTTTNVIYQSLYTMNPGDAAPNDTRGRVAMARAGNLMYYADTENNRVLIYARAGALDCDLLTDPYELQACLFQYASAPLQPSNILGQATTSETKTCSEYETICSPNISSQSACESANPICTFIPPTGNGAGTCSAQAKCLNKPRSVSVIGNRLYIADSGNNRVVHYNSLPVDGCDANAQINVTKPRICLPNGVIGKAGLFDTTNYSLSVIGDAILNSPTDIVAQDDKLYIADTGNNRIVRIDRYNDTDYFNCTINTWGGPLCKFKGVLGQEDFFTKTTFAEIIAANPSYLSGTIQDELIATQKDLLKRYFRSPSRIRIMPDGKMYVSANELFEMTNPLSGRNVLRGRILIFNVNPLKEESPLCNPGTFASGACDANDVIGQERFDRLAVVSGTGVNAYNQLQYGLYSVDDFDILDVPSEEENAAGSRVLMSVDSVSNYVYIWANINNRTADGYPFSYKVLDPAGAYNPITQQSAPDLKSLCGIRIVEDTSNIYVSDCGDSRVHEVQAYEIPTQ